MTGTAAVLLDVDGTLVDTNYFHTVAWFRAFRRGGRDVAMAELHHRVGMGADQFLAALVGEPDQALENAWSEEFAQLRGEVIALPGARDLVIALKQHGATTVYATSGQPEDVEVLRGIIGADEWVDGVVNSSEVDHSKPAPDIFQLALDRAGVAPDQAIVIGDTVWDVHAAAACGVRCVGLTSGGISASDLEAAGAVAVYENPAALLDKLDTSPVGALFATSSMR